jgi:hypothetical protein
MLLTVISFLLALAVAFVSFRLSRRFVRDRLRYVDAAQRASTPWIAGLGALLVGALIVALVPGLGAGMALTFALAVGSGVAAGARDVREGRGLLDDGRL